MNITNGSLFRLIKTMSAEEQKEFNGVLERSNATGGFSQYQILFNHLCGLAAYNEKKVKQELNEQIPAANFPVIKNHLREKLYVYLLTREPASGRNQIHQMLDEVEMLFSRQQHLEADILCQKIIAFALRLDTNHFVIETNHWRLLAQPHIAGKNYKEKIEEINAQQQLCLERMQLSIQLGKLNETVLAFAHQSANVRSKKFLSEVQQWLRHPLLKIEPDVKRHGILVLLLVEITKMELYRLQGKTEEAYQAQKRMMNALLADWEFYLHNKKQMVAAVVQNHFGAVSLTPHFKDFAKHLQLVEQLLKKEFRNEKFMFYTYTLNQFLYQLQTQKSKTDTAAFEEFYLKERTTLSPAFRHNYSLVYSAAMYQTGQYQKGIDALQIEINEYSRAQVREDQLEDFQISLLIQHYMLLLSQKRIHKNVNDFKIRLTPLYHSFRKKPKDEDFRLEMCLINLFKKIKFTSTPKQLLAQVATAEKKLKEIFSKPSPAHLATFYIFDHKEFVNRCRNYLEE